MNHDDGFSVRAEPILLSKSSGPVTRLVRAVALIGSFCFPITLHAQNATEPVEEPLVRKLTLNGVRQVDEKDLRLILATEPTRCKGLLLRPFCKITSSGFFTEKHHLHRSWVKQDELRLRVMYWRLGYRYAQVASTIKEVSGGVEVVFDITEGAPVIAQTVEVEQTRPLLNEQQIRRAGMLKPGSPVNLITVDSAEARLRSRLWDQGYGDALLQDTVVMIDSLHADVRLAIDPRPRTTVGTIEITGNEDVTVRTVGRLVDLRSGQLYRRTDVLAAQRRLYRSELFKQALIAVPDRPDSIKNIEVTVREAPSDAVRLGGGFNTIEFVQAEAEWTRYNWIGTARRLELRGAVGNLAAPQLYGKSIFGSAAPAGVGDNIDQSFLDPTWRLSASVTQPWLVSTRNSIGVSAFAHRRAVPGVVIDRGYGASATFTRQFAEQVPASLTYRFEETRVEGGDLYFCVNFGVCELGTIRVLRETNRLSPLNLTAFADRADDPLAPTTGYSARLELEHASAITMSDYRYNRAGAEAALYLRISRATLATHVRGGWINASRSTAQAVQVDDLDANLVHPSRRFYAGGARSVRGFAENQLGPRVLTVDPARLISPHDSTESACTVATITSGACDPKVASSRDFVPRPVGGSTLLEASVEYRYPITKTLIAAAFVDAGRVGTPSSQALSSARTAVTPGFGIRYRSPIGPIRMDLGLRPSTQEDLPVITQISDSTGALRLVQLKSKMRYDPLETSSGGLRKMLARFQLHLAIGEAY